MRQTEVTVKGTTYKLQSIPFKFYMDMVDKHTNKDGNLKRSGYITDIFKHCVIEPKVTMGSFDDDFPAALELAGEIENFLTASDATEAISDESIE